MKLIFYLLLDSRCPDSEHDQQTEFRLLFQENQDASKTAAGAGVREEDVTMLKNGWKKRVGRFVLPKKEDQLVYYDHYSCMPPPMFMILISAIEVRVSHLLIGKTVTMLVS